MPSKNALSSAFLVCVWPYAGYFIAVVGLKKTHNQPVFDAFVILLYLNSLINPCLYMIINRDVRFELKKIFLCLDPKLVHQSSLDEGSSSHDRTLSIRKLKKMFTIEEKEPTTEATES